MTSSTTSGEHEGQVDWTTVACAAATSVHEISANSIEFTGEKFEAFVTHVLAYLGAAGNTPMIAQICRARTYFVKREGCAWTLNSPLIHCARCGHSRLHEPLFR